MTITGFHINHGGSSTFFVPQVAARAGVPGGVRRGSGAARAVIVLNNLSIPVVPHNAVAEVSNIGNQ